MPERAAHLQDRHGEVEVELLVVRPVGEAVALLRLWIRIDAGDGRRIEVDGVARVVLVIVDDLRQEDDLARDFAAQPPTSDRFRPTTSCYRSCNTFEAILKAASSTSPIVARRVPCVQSGRKFATAGCSSRIVIPAIPCPASASGFRRSRCTA